MRYDWLSLTILFSTVIHISTGQAIASDSCLSDFQQDGLELLVRDDFANGPIQMSRSDQMVWLSPGQFVSSMLDLDHLPHVLTDPDELRYLPFSLAHTSVALLVDDFTLSAEQVNRVIAVAQTFHIKIHILWLDVNNTIPEIARKLALETKGVLSSFESLLQRPPCSQVSNA